MADDNKRSDLHAWAVGVVCGILITTALISASAAITKALGAW